MMKHSTVNPSPFVPFGKVWKGLAQAACAAFDGEKVGPVRELEANVVEIVELEDIELDAAKDIDEIEDNNELEDEKTEEVEIETGVDAVGVELSERLILLETLV